MTAWPYGHDMYDRTGQGHVPGTWSSPDGRARASSAGSSNTWTRQGTSARAGPWPVMIGSWIGHGQAGLPLRSVYRPLVGIPTISVGRYF